MYNYVYVSEFGSWLELIFTDFTLKRAQFEVQSDFSKQNLNIQMKTPLQDIFVDFFSRLFLVVDFFFVQMYTYIFYALAHLVLLNFIQTLIRLIVQSNWNFSYECIIPRL